MRIVVLDGHALNPGDLSWAEIEALGRCTVHPRTPPDQVVAQAAGAGAVLINKVLLTRAVFEALPDLRYVGVLATGYNVVDVAAARARGVVVTNVPAYSTPSVAQAVFALLLELTNGVADHARGVRTGRWSASPDFCYWDHPQVELAGRTLGLVGLGSIGRTVARIGQALGMAVCAHTRAPEKGAPEGVELVGLDELFARADVVSLHCPLTPVTQGLVSRERLARMKPTAYLLNTARGPLVDEAALAEALNAGRLAGAGLDVLSAEPPPAANPLLEARNCLITPHVAWATRAARERLLRTAAENLSAFLGGQPQNVVS